MNGLSQGGAYGDDAQSATNFPLVRITNSGTGHVHYARTSGFTTLSVAPNANSTANFTVPATIELGASSLIAVANGVPSARVAVTISTNTNASLQVTPSTNIAGSGTHYGPFEPAFFQYHLSASAGSLSYATSAPSWLNRIAVGRNGNHNPSHRDLMWSNDQSIFAGTYGGNVNFTNTINGQGNTSRSTTFTVYPLVVGDGGH